jgi:hypothetical protein
MTIPNVECVLGRHVMEQWAAVKGFEAALTERVKQLGESGFNFVINLLKSISFSMFTIESS